MSASLSSAATTKGTRPGHASATALPSAEPFTRWLVTACAHAGSGCYAHSGVAPQHGALCTGLARFGQQEGCKRTSLPVRKTVTPSA